MGRPAILILIVLAVCLVLPACGGPTGAEQVLRSYSLDDTQDVLTRSGVSIDREHSSDGRGSLRLACQQPTTFHLFELDGLDVEQARLIYRARLRTENVQGKVYLEMWCTFPGQGEYFSRALQAPITGTTEWTTQETPFFLQAGQRPERVKLNVVVEGPGTVWIDDMTLARGPLS